MKLFRFLLLLLLPVITYGQDTTVLKKQANLMAQATFNGNRDEIIKYTYPRLITLSGGEEKFRTLIAERIESLKRQGVTDFNGKVGSPGPFYQAGDEIHCLLPEQIIIQTNNARYLSRSYMLGISNDGGKNWTFLDVGNMPADVLLRILPNYNKALVIPEYVKPEYLPD